MKLKLLVRLVEKMLRMPESGEEPRADMYLPSWLLAFGIVLAAGAVGMLVAFLITWNLIFTAIAAICALLSAAAVLCWRNQTIRIVDENTFQYTTFLGNTKTYAFSDIRSLRKNSDSFTLYVGDGKVHVESIAVLSDRLVNKINEAVGGKTALSN